MESEAIMTSDIRESSRFTKATHQTVTHFSRTNVLVVLVAKVTNQFRLVSPTVLSIKLHRRL